MLDLAAKHEAELQARFADAFLDMRNIFYFGNGYMNTYKPDDGTWNKHEFVSVKGGKVIGYLAYRIDRRTNTAENLAAINFGGKNLAFSRDFRQFLKDIFEKFRFRKLVFGVYVGNPAEKMYDRYIRKFGGRIIGTERAATMLLDGKFYDYKQYEIFREDYMSRIQPVQEPKS